MLELASFVHNHTLGMSQTTLKTRPERGYQYLFPTDKTSNPPGLVAKPLRPSICLHYYGQITRTPKTGALPLCSALGQDFFMVADERTSPFMSDKFCHAWIVPEIKSGVPSMECFASSMTMPFTCDTGIKTNKLTE